jgi:RHS repeat-associated protein
MARTCSDSPAPTKGGDTPYKFFLHTLYWTTTWYSRDAQGNILATYRQQTTEDTVRFQTEAHTLYGSARLGTRDGSTTLVSTEILESGSTPVVPPAYEVNSCDIFLEDNHQVYTLHAGQRAVVEEGTNFSGTLIQNGGTLLVAGTFHANNYYYHGGDILVTGKLYGNTWNSEKPRFYEHCNYGGTWVELPEGNYDQASMMAMGIPDNWLSSVRAGKGYQITLYEHPGYTGKQLVLTEDHPCLSSDNFNDLNSALKIERISGNLSTCTPGAGTTNTVGTLTNYGTFSFATPTFPEGTKIYNYGTLNIANFHLPNTSEIHNFSGVTSTIFDIAPTASVYSKPASRIASVNLLIRGNVEGDAFNYSEITTANTTLQSSGSVDGLIKLCATQTFQGTGTIGSAVVRDCSFDIPVLKQRTASLYQAQQGHKAYELSNHLGNVLTTISDRRIGVAGSNPALIDHYTAVILSSQDYYAFGWEMPGRKYNSTNYRYGFNGKEDDVETGWQDYGERLYDKRTGRFFRVDPAYSDFAWYTPYQYSGNNPIANMDMDGMEDWYYLNGSKSNSVGPLEPFTHKSLIVDVSYNRMVKDNLDATHNRVMSQRKPSSLPTLGLLQPNNASSSPITVESASLFGFSTVSAAFALKSAFFISLGENVIPSTKVNLGGGFKLTSFKAGEGGRINPSSVRFQASTNTAFKIKPTAPNLVKSGKTFGNYSSAIDLGVTLYAFVKAYNKASESDAYTIRNWNNEETGSFFYTGGISAIAYEFPIIGVAFFFKDITLLKDGDRINEKIVQYHKEKYFKYRSTNYQEAQKSEASYYKHGGTECLDCGSKETSLVPTRSK